VALTVAVIARHGRGRGDPARDRQPVRVRLAVAAGLLVLAGCAAASRARAPSAAETTLSGYTYGEVWQAAVRAAGARSDIVEQDQSLGVLQADRRPDARSPGGTFHIFISPPIAGSAVYRVEVVAGPARPEREWARQILRHIRDLLEAGSPPPGSRGKRPEGPPGAPS
jgi:hypothetical protein